MIKETEMGLKEQYWLGVLEEWKQSGIGLESWCKSSGYSFYQVRYYQRKLRDISSKAGFVEVEDKQVPDTPKIRRNLIIEIGQAKVFVPDGFCPIMLGKVVQVLEGFVC